MSFYPTVFELIDMRSFSNLWFWLALAAVWSTASHYVLGVPWDMVNRAEVRGGRAQEDLELLVRLRVARLVLISEMSGPWLVALGALGLSSLALLGFAYGVEFAQALFLMMFPLSVVGLLGLSSAERIAGEALGGAALRRRLARHRRVVQVIGLVSIFVTAMWGMYQNMSVGPLG